MKVSGIQIETPRDQGISGARNYIRNSDSLLRRNIPADSTGLDGQNQREWNTDDTDLADYTDQKSLALVRAIRLIRAPVWVLSHKFKAS